MYLGNLLSKDDGLTLIRNEPSPDLYGHGTSKSYSLSDQAQNYRLLLEPSATESGRHYAARRGLAFLLACQGVNVSGYNVYRAIYTNPCGSFSKINSLLNTSTLYTDSAATDGTSYCYATTAVNTNNQESAYSNIASPVQIPAP